jgi:arginase
MRSSGPERLAALLAATLAVGPAARAQVPQAGPQVALVKMAYRGERNVAELSEGPESLERGGIAERLQRIGCRLKPTADVRLTPEEQKQYGEWHRLGLANGQLGRIVAANQKEGYASIGLLANCSSILGMLAGLQHSGRGARPQRVGMVFIDAHGDFNTPETTLSGMLGGMPVAIATGLGLHRLRQKAGLDPALPTSYVVLAGVRDTDPLEQELIDRSQVELLSVEDIRARSDKLQRQMQRLAALTDVIYVHVDMDVLDPREVEGHPLAVPNGPTSLELAAAIEEMFRNPKAAAFGVASTPFGERDKGGLSRQAAYNLIEGAIRGIKRR